MTLTDIVYYGNGFTATFDDGSVSNALFKTVDGKLTTIGLNQAQQAALIVFNATIDIPYDPRFDENSIEPIESGGAFEWQKFTVAATAFTAVAATENIELLSLAAGGIIHGVKIKHSVAFTGGMLSALTLSVGISGTLAKYASAFDVFQAVSDTTFQLSNVLGSEDHGAATSIRLAAVATGDNLSNVGTGSVDVWVLVSEAI